jgi:hypothetical protein
LLAQQVSPDEVLSTDDPQEASLFIGEDVAAKKPAAEAIKVPSAFMEMAKFAAAHTDTKRWALLYRVL